MRIIVSIQAKRESSRGLIHYIAHSKTDSEKEPKTRELFTEYSDHVSVETANDFLKTGVEKKRPENGQLHHVVISLKADDYKKLGVEETERQRSLKTITRAAIERFAESIGADKISWTAGIHRNTQNPHVHIAIQKEYFDKSLEKKTLAKIPNILLPHYEKDGESKTFVPGILIAASMEKLDEIITKKERTFELPSRENEVKEHHSSSQESNNYERDILARAILAKYHLEKSRDNIDSLENHGDKRRFKINDVISGQTRLMSLFDLERRAKNHANQNLKLKEITDPIKHEAEKTRLIDAEMSQNIDGIKRIKTILHKLTVKEHQNLKENEAKYDEIKPLAEKIRLQYRRENRKLPTPNLTLEEIETLQAQSIEKGDVRKSQYFERVREAVSEELGIPKRNDKQVAKLKAIQVLFGLKVQSREKQLADFMNQKRHFPIAIDGTKWTLAKIDKFVDEKAKSDKTVGGKIGSVLSKLGLLKSVFNQEKLEEIKSQIIEKLDDQSKQISMEKKRENSIYKMLNGFVEKVTNPEKKAIQPKFTAFELAEVERLSFELKIADVYRDNFEHQKALVNSLLLGNNFEHHTIKKVNEIIAGRAVAREILCEFELSRSKEVLAKFKEFKVFQKFEIVNPKTNTSQFVSLKEVEFDSRGSIFDQTLEYFFENRDKRKMRTDVEKLAKLKEIELKSDVSAAKMMLKTTNEETVNYKSRSIFGLIKYDVQPVFTAKELITIELRIAETDVGREAKKLQKMLDTLDYSKVQNLAAILEELSMDQKFAQHSTIEPLESKESNLLIRKEKIDVNKER
jgi:MobL relaxases